MLDEKKQIKTSTPFTIRSRRATTFLILATIATKKNATQFIPRVIK